MSDEQINETLDWERLRTGRKCRRRRRLESSDATLKSVGMNRWARAGEPYIMTLFSARRNSTPRRAFLKTQSQLTENR